MIDHPHLANYCLLESIYGKIGALLNMVLRGPLSSTRLLSGIEWNLQWPVETIYIL